MARTKQTARIAQPTCEEVEQAYRQAKMKKAEERRLEEERRKRSIYYEGSSDDDDDEYDDDDAEEHQNDSASDFDSQSDSNDDEETKIMKEELKKSKEQLQMMQDMMMMRQQQQMIFYQQQQQVASYNAQMAWNSQFSRGSTVTSTISKPRRAYKKKERPLKTTELEPGDVIFRLPFLKVGFEHAIVESVTCTTKDVKIKAYKLEERKCFNKSYFYCTEGRGNYQWQKAGDMTEMMPILKDVEQFVVHGSIDILKYVDYDENGTIPYTLKRRLERINNIIGTTRFIGDGKAIIVKDHPESCILTGQFWRARGNATDEAIAYGQTRMDVDSFNMACKWARYIEGEKYYLVSEKAECHPKHMAHYLKFFHNM